jgi:gas vesicle protein
MKLEELTMAQEDNGGRFIWFVAGSAIGAAIALLYAPQSGEETRRVLGRKAQEGRDALAESGRDMMERGRDLYERGRKLADEAADMFEHGRNIIDKASDSISENLHG